MKERIIKVLQVTRKFGFIMAAVMVFPYVSSFPAVMASDGETTVEPHEVTIEELEQQYELNDEQNEMLESEMEKFQSTIESELAGYIVEVEPNIYEVSIPDGVVVDLTESELNQFKHNLDITNQMLRNDEIIIDENGDFYTRGVDDQFFTQWFTYYTKDVYKTYSLTVKVGFINKTVKTSIWIGKDVKFTRAGSLVLGLGLFGVGVASGKVSSATLKTKVNQFYGTGLDYWKTSVVPKMLTYSGRIEALASGIKVPLNLGGTGDFTMKILGFLSTLTTAVVAIQLYFASVTGGLSTVFSVLFALSGSYISGKGIEFIVNGALYGSSLLKYRAPASLVVTH